MYKSPKMAKSKSKKNKSVREKDDVPFREFAENASDIIFNFSFKPTPRYTYVSPSVKKILGYAPSEFYKDPLLGFKLIHPEDRKLLLDSQKNLESRKGVKGIILNLTARYLSKNGAVVWLENRYDASYRNKTIVSIHCIGRDITEQKTGEKELSQRWANYNNLVENLPVAVIISDMQGRIIFANPKAIDLAKSGGKGGLNVNDFVKGKYAKVISERREKLRHQEELSPIRIEARTAAGKKLRLEIHSAVMMYNGRQAVQTIINNITINHQLEVAQLKVKISSKNNRKLQMEISKREEIEQKLKAIFNSSTHLIWTVNKAKEITSFNEQYAKSVQLLCNDQLVIGKKLSDFAGFFANQDYKKLHDAYFATFKGKQTLVEIQFIGADGKRYHREINLHPIYQDEKISEVAAIAQDITERKNHEAALLEKQSQLSALINTTGDIIFSIDGNFHLVEFNNLVKERAKEHLAINLKSGQSIFDLIPKEKELELRNILQTVMEGKNITSQEPPIYFGEIGRNFETHYHPIRSGRKIMGIAVFSRDVTDQKMGERQILKSLNEKEVLLKEVHHRVKNNLQVISSILNLQTAYLRDKSTISLLKECQNRIKTMAFIHESLYQNSDMSEINFGDYIITLVKNLFYSFETDQRRIRPFFEVEPVFLNLDLSIPCGLIINELVSNALKYAFDIDQEGSIFVGVKRRGGRTSITISDNGKGMPENINFKSTETLGLQLVVTLVEQINGKIEMTRDKGTKFEIRF